MAANKVHWWDAPKGYKAIKRSLNCKMCAFEYDIQVCMDTHAFFCNKEGRKDKQDVIFVKRDNNK